MTEATIPEVTDPAHTIETVAFDETYIDQPFIPSRDPKDVKAFLAAFAKSQSEYQPVLRERTVTIKPREGPAYQFKYAELANVIDATKALSKNGITVTQPVHEDRNKKMWLYTIVAHASGAGQVTRLSLMGAPDMKVFGGEITYIRRYTFGPAIGVASEDDADDNGTGPRDEPRGRGDEGGYSRERVDAPPPSKPTPQRKAPAEPAVGKDAAAAAKPTAGALKNVLGKLAALGLVKEDETAMLAGLEVSENPDNWTLADWQKVKAEVERRMAA